MPNKSQLSAISLSGLDLSKEQLEVFNQIENKSDVHYFITGKAGTGKSVLLQYLRQNTKRKSVVLAPTGVAALNVAGQTIHSFFKIPPEFIASGSLKLDKQIASLLANLEVVIIDEISMVRADLMDAIDHLLRLAKKRPDLAFGGVQMVLFGDIYQLPPIVSDPALLNYFQENHGGFHFIHAKVWKRTQLVELELTEIFRQSSTRFKEILQSIRTASLSDLDLSEVNARADAELPESGVIVLATTNRTVNQINENRLAQIEKPIFEYSATTKGYFEKTSFPADEVLRLKVGAQVMMLKNDPERRWVNGTLGEVADLEANKIFVRIGKKTHEITSASWDKVRYFYDSESNSIEPDVVSSFAQFPIRLAWAITIHKSQGQTFEKVGIDLGWGSFAPGQTYVAFSRCQSLEGIYLSRPLRPEDIIKVEI